MQLYKHKTILMLLDAIWNWPQEYFETKDETLLA